MTSQARVRLVLEHQEPDRVPLDLGSLNVTAVSATAYKQRATHLEMNDFPSMPIFDAMQQLPLWKAFHKGNYVKLSVM